MLQISAQIKKCDLFLKTASGQQRARRTQNSFTNALVLDFTVQKGGEEERARGEKYFFLCGKRKQIILQSCGLFALLNCASKPFIKDNDELTVGLKQF